MKTKLLNNKKTINYKKIGTFYMFGTLFNQGISFLTVPIFTRLLSVDDYGMVSTYNSMVSIFSIVISCAVYMAIRSAFVDFEMEINDFLATMTSFTVLNGLAFMVGGAFFSVIFNMQNLCLVIVLCMVHSCGAALVQNYSMYLMMKYKYKERTAILILPNLIAVIISLVIIVFVLKSDLYLGRIVPTSIVQGLFGIIIAILIYRKSHVIFEKKYLKYALSLSLPLVFHGLALNILSQSDRLMITWLKDASETGIYSLVYNLGMIATVIVSALDGVWVPWFTGKLKQGKVDSINDRAKVYIEIMTVAMIALILVAPEIVKIMADERYWVGISIVPPIVLANYLIFGYTMYVNVEHFYKKTTYITFNTLIAAAFNIVANLIFIPQFGYIAAAYTTLCSYLIAFTLHTRYAKKMNHDLYPNTYFLLPFLKVLVSVIIFYLFINNVIIRWCIAVVFCAYEAIQNKNLIIEFMRK